MPAIVKLKRRNRPEWEFQWEDKYNGYIHVTKNKTIYKIIFSNCLNPCKYGFEPDIWIGRLHKKNHEYFWTTCEKDIKAESIIMFRGQYNFN